MGALAKLDNLVPAFMKYSIEDEMSVCSWYKVDSLSSLKCLKASVWKSQYANECPYNFKSHALHYILIREQRDASKFKLIQFLEELLILQMELNIGWQALPKSKPFHTT